MSLKLTFFSPGGLHDESIGPVAEEARDRGHTVEFCRDNSQRAKIGIYTQDTDKIPSVNSDVSFISFHGIDQGYNSPIEGNWNRFDVGLLPNEVAVENWKCDSWRPRLRPNIGVFRVGWPKSDFVFTTEFKERVDQIQQECQIDGLTTIYAPTVENNGKIHQYVDATKNVADTVLIKHAPYESELDLNQLYKVYRDDENVEILNQSEPIFPCLAAADVLVSDESSVLQEAALTETVPISVTDWPMKNRTRTYPGSQVPEFALQTKQDELQQTLMEVFETYENHIATLERKRDRHYAHLGKSSSVVVDLIEALAAGETPPIEPVSPIDRHISLTRRSYFKLRQGIAKPYHRSRAKLVHQLSDEDIKRLENLGLHKVLHLFDRVFGKSKYR